MKLVIIPTYNEAENIERLILDIFKIASDFNILVIDDNSPDGTGRIIDRLNNEDKKINVIHREKKLGIGSAYVEGFRWAFKKNFTHIFTMDADLSHNPSYLRDFIKKLDVYDMVIGSRYVKSGGITGWPLYRRLISYFGNLYAYYIAGMRINDSTSGFMGFRMNSLKNIDLNTIKTEGYGFLIELKYNILKARYSFTEIPIIFNDRKSGKSKISQKIIFEAMLLVLKLRFKNER